MLAQFALLVFAFFAVLSLVIDVGYARITQAQMQNAADSAAIEGLRKRDIGVLNPATGQTVDDPFASDCLRRTAANQVVRWVFDDDFNVTNGGDYRFGAGPIIDLTDTDAVSNLHAFETMSVPDTPVYKPDLQLNQQNAVYGDMVSGRFCYSADPAASEGLAYADPATIVCSSPQNGTGVYARNDFNPNATAPQPPVALPSCPPPDEAPPDPWPLGGSGTLANDDAFLVRLRRSNELQDFAAQTEPNVASSGPSLPLVFGRGTMISGDDPASDYSIRRDGVTVRAAAIAQTRPAMHVGLPQTNPSLPGATRFALIDTFVQTLNANGCPVTVNPVTGLVVSASGGAGCPAAGATVGRFVANAATISTVGRALAASVAAPCASVNALAGYGPVYSLMVSSGTNRIIGFTRIGLTRAGACPANAAAPFAATISRGVSLVAAANATAILTGGLPLPIGAAPAEITELLNKNGGRGAGAVNYAPVLAPALAR